MAVDEFEESRAEPKRERLVSPLIMMLLGLVTAAFVVAALVPDSNPRPRVRRRAAAIAEIVALKNGITTFQAYNGRLPRAEEGLDALVHAPVGLAKTWSGPYFDHVGPDPWGHAYRYVCPADTKSGFNIISLGSDGVEGTDDDIDVHTAD